MQLSGQLIGSMVIQTDYDGDAMVSTGQQVRYLAIRQS
jgi:hypothetical protein